VSFSLKSEAAAVVYAFVRSLRCSSRLVIRSSAFLLTSALWFNTHHLLSPVRTPKVFAKAQHTRVISHVWIARHETTNTHTTRDSLYHISPFKDTHSHDQSGVKRWCLVSHTLTAAAQWLLSAAHFFLTPRAHHNLHFPCQRVRNGNLHTCRVLDSELVEENQA